MNLMWRDILLIFEHSHYLIFTRRLPAASLNYNFLLLCHIRNVYKYDVFNLQSVLMFRVFSRDVNPINTNHRGRLVHWIRSLTHAIGLIAHEMLVYYRGGVYNLQADLSSISFYNFNYACKHHNYTTRTYAKKNRLARWVYTWMKKK